MKIKEFLEKLDTFTEEERDTVLRQAVKMLCPISVGTMQKFQIGWDKDKFPDAITGYMAFKEEQNKVVKLCFQIETDALIGDEIRREFGLEPITMETEVVCENSNR